MYTNNDFERLAYIAGNAAMANVYAKAADFDAAEENIDADYLIDFTLQDQIDAKIAAAIAKQCPDYAQYKQFFEECFSRLNAHYPCPSVTSDYDQSVIFDAIEKGEQE